MNPSQMFSANQKGNTLLIIIVLAFVTLAAIIGVMTVNRLNYYEDLRQKAKEQGGITLPATTPNPISTYKLEDAFSIRVPEGWIRVSATSAPNAESYGFIGNTIGLLILSPDYNNGAKDQPTGVFIGIDRRIADHNEDLQKDLGQVLQSQPQYSCGETIENVVLDGVHGYKKTCYTTHKLGHIEYDRFYLFKSGQYKWIIQTYGYKTNPDYISQIDQILSTFKFTDQNGAMVMDERTAATCDFNGDGICNQADLTVFQKALGKHRGDSDYNLFTDADGDGVITTTDQKILFPTTE